MLATRRFVRDTGLVVGRTAKEAIGNAGLAFVAPTLIAVFLIILFQGVYGKIAETAGWPTDQFIDWVAPGGVLLSVFVGAGYTAGGLLRDADSGYLDRIRLLPTNPATVLAGKVAFEAARAAVPATGVLFIALALGADNRNGLPGALGVIAIAMALSVAWNGIFYLSALATRNHAAVLGLQPLFMPVIMFSTFCVPTRFMPGWYETVATWNPFTPTLDAARSIMLGHPDWGGLGIGLTSPPNEAPRIPASTARRSGSGPRLESCANLAGTHTRGDNGQGREQHEVPTRTSSPRLHRHLPRVRLETRPVTQRTGQSRCRMRSYSAERALLGELVQRPGAGSGGAPSAGPAPRAGRG